MVWNTQKSSGNSTEYTRRDTLGFLTTLAAAGVLGSGTAGATSAHDHSENGATLNRFASTVAGAEFTGIFLTEDGQLFFNVQHPSEEANENVRPGAVGSVAGVNMNQLPADFESVQPPKPPAEYVKTAKGEYQILAEGKDETDTGKLLGIPYSASGEPMTEGKGNDPDFNGFVPSDDSADEGYLFTNWEDVPGMVSRLHVTQACDTGEWTVLEKMNVDFHDVQGTWTNCFGTVSPWGTPLTSEEYEPDAQAWFAVDEQTYHNQEAIIEDYLGHFGNAYRYGYIVEIDEPQSDEPTPVKHHVMGRFAHENAVVMPDRKTAYMSDDGTGTVFFKFVADEPGDLSSGTLYAAAAKQQGPGGDPRDVSFKLDWIELAHGSNDQIEEWIAEYDDQEPSKDPSYITDEEVEAWANGNADDDRAAFLESRKAATALGATDEFRKMEGTNIRRNAKPGDYVYMAMSEINETMRPNSATDEFDDPQDDVRLEKEDYGAVYRMKLDGNYNVHRMEPAIVGGDHATICGGCPYDAHPHSKNNVCQDCAFNPESDANTQTESKAKQSNAKILSRAGRASSKSISRAGRTNAGVNKLTGGMSSLLGKGMSSLMDTSTSVDPENTIANPDNLVVMPDGRVIIGEDSGFHRPNMLWVYAPKHLKQ
jgi:secreted PhoX family phosphatase